MTWSLTLNSLTTYGPVPIGLVRKASEADLPASRTCLGRMKPKVVPVNGSYQVSALTEPFSGLAIHSQVKATSAAVNGVPSLQSTPGLSEKVTLVRSGASWPLSTVG